MATIEVLLPVKNALPFLPESIESVLAQTFQDWRLLILDHGSTDGSVDVAQKYAETDKRVVVHSNPSAQGLGGLLNFGLDVADGRFVVRQDGDDISVPDRFQAIVDAFSAEPDLLVFGGEAVVVDAAGNEIGYISLPDSSRAIAAASFFFNPIAHPAVAMNLPRLRQIGARYGDDLLKVLPPEKSLKIMSLAEDYFLFGQLALLGKCKNVKAPHIRYRVHDRSESISKQVAQNACALGISRFLAQSFAVMHGTSAFDPGPFCSHAENVFDCGAADYTFEFRQMAGALEKGLGKSFELTRELAFRQVLAKRRWPEMAVNYMKFALRYGRRADEYRVVRNWLGRFVNSKNVTCVEGGVLSFGGAEARSGS